MHPQRSLVFPPPFSFHKHMYFNTYVRYMKFRKFRYPKPILIIPATQFRSFDSLQISSIIFRIIVSSLILGPQISDKFHSVAVGLKHPLEFKILIFDSYFTIYAHFFWTSNHWHFLDLSYCISSRISMTVSKWVAHLERVTDLFPEYICWGYRQVS